MLRKNATKRVIGSLAAAVVLTGVTGCQNDADSVKSEKKPKASAGPTAAPRQVLADAGRKVIEAKSAKFTSKVSTPASGKTPAGEMKLSGTIGFKPVAMDVTMDVGAAAPKDGPVPSRVIYIDDVLYMKTPDQAAEGAGGKKWFKMDLSGMEESDDSSVGQLGNLNSLGEGLDQQLAMARGSAGIKHVGPDTVNGQKTEQYESTATTEEIAKSLENVKDLSADDRAKTIAKIKAAGIKSYRFNVWIDGKGYPVRVALDAKTDKGTVKNVSDYSDYGTTAKVTAPPAKDTADLAQLMKDAMTGAGS